MSAPTASPRVAVRLDQIRLAVFYPADEFVKCQAWDAKFIRETDRIVFDVRLMAPAEAKRLRSRHDWRKVPCLARYRVNGLAPQVICERGPDGSRRRTFRTGGRPIGIEFKLVGDGGAESYYHFTEPWLNDTGCLAFERPLVPDPGAPTTPIVTRRTFAAGATGVSEIIDPVTMGSAGRLAIDQAWGEVACGFSGPRTEWA